MQINQIELEAGALTDSDLFEVEIDNGDGSFTTKKVKRGVLHDPANNVQFYVTPEDVTTSASLAPADSFPTLTLEAGVYIIRVYLTFTVDAGVSGFWTPLVPAASVGSRVTLRFEDAVSPRVAYATVPFNAQIFVGNPLVVREDYRVVMDSAGTFRIAWGRDSIATTITLKAGSNLEAWKVA